MSFLGKFDISAAAINIVQHREAIMAEILIFMLVCFWHLQKGVTKL